MLFKNYRDISKWDLIEVLPNEEKSNKDFADLLKKTFINEKERLDYMEKHYIPQGIDLDFKDFVIFTEKRKQAMKEQFKVILQA